MVHIVAIWLLVAAFTGAGTFNAIGTPATRESFARWGYPRWWARLTGAAEIVIACLIALPATRHGGLALGAVVIAAAMATVLRAREFSHMAPLGAFAVLLLAPIWT